MKVGIIGGGGGLAASLEAAGIAVVGCAAGDCPVDPGIERVEAYQDFLEALDYPRRYVLDMPPGAAIDAVIDTAYQTMEPGDVVIDATASYWGDTLRRYRRMRHRSLFYQDIARLAGPEGSVLVVSGDAKGLALTTDLLAAWALPGGLRPVAGAGFAHYLAMLEAAGTAARRQLAGELNQLVEAYPGEVEESDKAAFCTELGPLDLGRAGWLLDDAVRLEAAVPLTAQALMLGIGEALEAHQSTPPPPRGAFVHPDDIL
ncbi:MAG: NAD(P)-binding domain-containing protein [Geminicoccaceae bacterium]